MPRLIDLHGQRFGRLLVLSRFTSKASGWLCECDCGNTTIVESGSLRSGDTKSCGCLRRERTIESHFKHGQHGTTEYNIWKGINQRCHSPTCEAYPRYGGRGITVCDEWRDDFQAFLNDMGKRPSPSMSIDRIDNNAGYSKSNCRWATRKQQSSNRITNIPIEFDGQVKLISEWSEITGIKAATLYRRFHAGWKVYDILFKPVRNWGH